MINSPNNAIITANVKMILDYLNRNGHRFDVNGHFDHRPKERDTYTLISDETDGSSANHFYPWPILGGQAKPKNQILELDKIKREIRAWEESYRKSEREGIKLDLEKCDEIRGRELGACRRRWKEHPILSFLFPDTYERCKQRVRERYDHCSKQHKMPAENPEYGLVDVYISERELAPSELDVPQAVLEASNLAARAKADLLRIPRWEGPIPAEMPMLQDRGLRFSTPQSLRPPIRATPGMGYMPGGGKLPLFERGTTDPRAPVKLY